MSFMFQKVPILYLKKLSYAFHTFSGYFTFIVLQFCMLLLFLWQMVEKLSHHCSGIPVEFDGVLEHVLVDIVFRAM